MDRWERELRDVTELAIAEGFDRIWLEVEDEQLQSLASDKCIGPTSTLCGE